MANLEIREEIKKSRLFHYEIADALGVSESAFSKWLRSEMDREERKGYASNRKYKAQVNLGR